MKLLYIYNPEAESERNTLESVISSIQSLVEVEAISFMDVKDKYSVSKTPTIIATMDNLVSDNLLDFNTATNELELIGLIKRMNNLEFYTQFNSTTATQLKEVEINQKVETAINAKLKEIADAKEREETKQSIIKQLNELDIVVPRIVEDIVEQGNYALHESKIAVIEQKKQLREQLKTL